MAPEIWLPSVDQRKEFDALMSRANGGNIEAQKEVDEKLKPIVDAVVSDLAAHIKAVVKELGDLDYLLQSMRRAIQVIDIDIPCTVGVDLY